MWPEEDHTGPLGLAVSGGPDSLALLLLAHVAFPDRCAVASVDHGLRPEAAGEVAMVERVCASLDVPFTALKVAVPRGNLQAGAREARYRALAEWAQSEGLGAVATAHHAEDQAETLMMRLARGSGLSGLAGVRAATTMPGCDIALVRPLLSFRRAELEALVAASGIEPVRDPSNTDESFDRVRMRGHLAGLDWLDAEPLARSAQHLAEAWRAIEWYAQIDWEEMVFEDADGDGSRCYRYYANVPRAIQVETVRRIVASLGGEVSRSEAGRAADRLWRGENASLGGVLAKAGIERMERLGLEMRVWRFRAEPPRTRH
ncbi:tRNA lysidine(34) synthetase TilS [Erythrobacter sp.]|uniref:tRNA lysidine(34) synthetase TilS n=1 Tax=Erythrobacter sp. TaxID=1042 RepID=UPI003C74FCCD